MRYTALKDYITLGLSQPGSAFNPTGNKPVVIYPGPNDPEGFPGRFIVLSRIGGPGLQVDGLIDSPGYQVKCVGDQENYQDSEDLAMLVDAWLINTRSGWIDSIWVVEIARVGAPPVPLLVDDADRTHFVCNYTTSVRSGVK